MKKFLAAGLFLGGLPSSAQVVAGGGVSITVPAGVVFSFGGEVFTPSSTFTISNNTITQSTTPVAGSAGGGSISNVYNNASPLLFSGTLRLNYNDADLNGNNESLLQFSYKNGGVWTQMAPTSASTTANYIEAAVANLSFIGFTTTQSGTVLSLLSRSFSGAWGNAGATLHWSVSDNRLYTGFAIERMENNRWINAGYVTALPGSGNKAYEITDGKEGGTERQYRLKLIEINGRTSYSNVIALRKTAGAEISIRPASGGVVIQLNGLKAGSIKVFTVSGQNIWQTFAASGLLSVNHLTKGAYFVQIVIDNEVIERNFTVYY